MVLRSFGEKEEADRCLLCEDAPCTQHCSRGMKPDRLIRSVYFCNERGAADSIAQISCLDCDAPCEKACILQNKTKPIEIKKILCSLEEVKKTLDVVNCKSVDLSCSLCGVPMENPFLLSSSVVASNYEMCAKAFEQGFAGAAFKTICTFEQHEASPRFSMLRGRDHAFYGFKNIEQLSGHQVEEDLDTFRRLKADYPTKVIVASIMGQNEQEWTELASACEEAGADVIECNFSCPNMEDRDLGVTIGQSPELIERFTRAVRRGCSIPILAKMTPNITDMVPCAVAAKRGGADGIAAINTIQSITGVNLDTLTPDPSVKGKSFVGGYSGVAVKPIALRFISDLAKCEELKGLHISGMGGIETWQDALEFILLGAGSLQLTTAVMQYGYRVIDDLLDGMAYYLAERGISRISDLVGASTDNIVSGNELERDTILFPKFHKDLCIGCGRCYISCYDGGHQAIQFDQNARYPKLDGKKCVGCHLCRLVCPADAIGVVKKRISIK
ncbi:MAG: NAD-dependent dihydropyrimidine dehydrogenase subunit PreA [Clostridia bacterium]|nr:NAD-dependent dihydropyrimidine dehydrogenase subunit PreA [Clostridia bacterium]